MTDELGVVELVAAAQARAKVAQTRLSELASASDSAPGDIRAATQEIELTAIDIYTVFEARMQHHFRRGPFSRKLSAMLQADGQADLADRVSQYYLAVNVLKHGKGDSYRTLLNEQNAWIVVNPANDENINEDGRHFGLIDVTQPGFFDGLCQTILDEHSFLEKPAGGRSNKQ